MSPKLRSQLRHVDPTALLPGLDPQLGQLDAPGAFKKIMRERHSLSNVAKKKLPLNFKSVVKDLIVGHLEPVLAKLEGISDVRVPDRTRRIHTVLRSAFTQSGNRAAQRAIDLHAEKFVTVNTKRPGGIDLRNDAAVKFECPVSCIVCRALEAISTLINPLRDGSAA